MNKFIQVQTESGLRELIPINKILVIKEEKNGNTYINWRCKQVGLSLISITKYDEIKRQLEND